MRKITSFLLLSPIIRYQMLVDSLWQKIVKKILSIIFTEPTSATTANIFYNSHHLSQQSTFFTPTNIYLLQECFRRQLFLPILYTIIIHHFKSLMCNNFARHHELRILQHCAEPKLIYGSETFDNQQMKRDTRRSKGVVPVEYAKNI